MKGTTKYYKQFYIDGKKTNYKEVAQILGIKEQTARNIYNFEIVDTRDYKGHELSYKYVKMVRVFNVNGRITENHNEVANWLGLGTKSLYSYICSNKNGWSYAGNTVTFHEEFREIDYTTMKRILRPRDLSELVEVEYTHDVVDYNGVRIVRKMSGDTLIKSYGWSVGQKYLQA